MTPTSKQRPRYSNRGQFISTYTPPKTKAAEGQIAAAFKKAYPDVYPTDEPVSVRIKFIFAPPKSWSKKRRAATIEQPCMCPKDVDNLAKLVLDALMAWHGWTTAK
jgi:Holliday junction resolvase RusA-like endonuclease